MRYIYAIAACFALFILYALIGAMLGWKHGGGAIPMIFFRCVGWKVEAITKKGDEK